MPLPASAARHGWWIAILAIYLYVFPYYPRIHSANELPRAYLVKAIVDHHTFRIDDGVAHWGATADVSPFGGHQYSNKAPGATWVAVPLYAVASLFGEPSLATTVWLGRVASGILPTLLLLWLLARQLTRTCNDAATRRLVLVAYAFGSLAMTYALVYYGHQLAATCLAAAWILATDVIAGDRSDRWMAVVGGLAGASVLVEYQAAFAGVPVAVYVIGALARRRDRRALVLAIARAAIGAAIPIGALLAYHTVCFGSPLKTGYDASATFAHFHQHGFLGITALRSAAFWGSLFAADNGLFALAPWLALALPGWVVMWRRGRRAEVALAVAVVVVMVLFVSSINFWRGGWGVGPRYITIMLPFMLPGVAAAIDAARARPVVAAIGAGLALAGVAIYALSSATMPYWPDALRDPLYEVTLRLAHDGAFAPSIGTWLGVPAWLAIVPWFAAIAAITGVAIYRVVGARGLAIAAAIAVVYILAFSRVPHGDSEAERIYQQTVYPAVTS